jgi:hypothetical protein
VRGNNTGKCESGDNSNKLLHKEFSDKFARGDNSGKFLCGNNTGKCESGDNSGKLRLISLMIFSLKIVGIQKMHEYPKFSHFFQSTIKISTPRPNSLFSFHRKLTLVYLNF